MTAILLYCITVVSLLLMTVFLHRARGWFGDRLADALCAAPGLDVVVFLLTTAPQLVAIGIGIAQRRTHFWGTLWLLVVAILAQASALIIWMRVHEWLHPEARKGPRITKSLNRAVGPVRNTFAVWWTAWATPVFTIVRVAEYTVYPVLTWVIKLPRYKQSEWVNVSRQKHEHLVGADRIWCLYCDWMTGIWSLGSEMLRNIESFWCPIQFSSAEKCENCALDFPDVKTHWTPADGDMAGVTALLESQYPGPGGVNAWFGSSVRAELTVGGQKTSAPSLSTQGGDQGV